MKLKGKGFILRHIRLSDVQAFFECYRGKNIKEFLLKIPKNLVEAKKELKKRVADLGKGKPFGETFAIEVNGEFAGYVDLSHLNLENSKHKCEIGYALRPRFKGKGLASKATKLLTEYAFKKYKLKRISAMGRAKNKASARVLEKAGYKLEGILRKNKCVEGKYLDDFIYAKLK
ncbi:MAG: GNAT family N-acetyltransferase [Nanoarchaeota archaeon]|nr:GNAT family N-acetyltransferase [Nanoarchaeota archaeon]